MDKNKKRILITAIGAPPHGYKEVNWQFKGKEIPTPLPIIAIASVYKVDHILILGTKEALDEKRVHHQQLQQELKKYQLNEKISSLEIGALNSREEFWQAFEAVANNMLFKIEEVELYVDLTFGYRIQPMLIFLAAYFLNETAQNVKLKKVLYGMDKAQPPHILDMTELVYLLDWLKGVQMFVQGGSAKVLSNNFDKICGHEHKKVAHAFLEFTDAYAFNYIADIKQKAANFQKEYKNKYFRREVRNKFPIFELIHPYFLDFINSFIDDNEIEMQLKAAQRNFEDNAYSRAVLILREVYITFFMSALGLQGNDDRKKVEDVLINRIYFTFFNKDEQNKIPDSDKEKAQRVYEILNTVFGEELLNILYENWGGIREIRNTSGHIRNIQRGDKKEFYSKFDQLKAELNNYLQTTEKLLRKMQEKLPLTKERSELLKSFLQEELNLKNLFIIVNEGLHPILPKLKEQFGEHIHVEVLTAGNVELYAEKEIAQKCKTLAEKYHDHKIYLVPSGFPYLAVAAYNVLQQTLARHPIWLQYDRESGKYLEKNLDPRKLIKE